MLLLALLACSNAYTDGCAYAEPIAYDAGLHSGAECNEGTHLYTFCRTTRPGERGADWERGCEECFESSFLDGLHDAWADCDEWPPDAL